MFICFYNIAKVGNDLEKWPAKVPEPLVSSNEQSSSAKEILDFRHGSSNTIDPLDKSDKFNHHQPHLSETKRLRNHAKPSNHEILSDKDDVLQSPFNQMNSIDTIFYQLNMKTKNAIISNTTTQLQHDQEAREACSINNELDNHVQIEGDRLFAFNLLASNRIGFFRSLPDTRHNLCKKSKLLTNSSIISNQTSINEDKSTQKSRFPRYYPMNVEPKASIIICYYNEAPSALLRTIYTVIRRTPSELLQEIIIIDDFSENDFHLNKIKPFIEELKIVSLHRTDRREGLIRARLLGSKLATGEVLVFLDSHVEANEAWLEPLIHQIRLDRTTVACPMIDLINPTTMIYTSSPMVVGATSWSLHFKWISVPSEDLATNEDFIKPLKSPTMAGGLYAIDKEFFHYLGEYDPGMELWGGENVEISFRIWLCGGRVVVLSCSRVGHIFRKRRPYGPEPDKPDCLLYNSHRAARVWLGDYIEHFYDAEPGAVNLDSGDVTGRVALKEKLDCKNFDWYVKNVYKELGYELDRKHENTTTIKSQPKLFKASRRRVDRGIHRTTSYNNISETNNVQLLSSGIPETNLDVTGHTDFNRFLIQAGNTEFCIRARESPFSKGFYRLVLGDCLNYTESINETSSNPSHQKYWFKSVSNELRLTDNQCLDLIKNLPLLRRCHNLGYFQTWLIIGDGIEPSNIYNIKSGLCLAVERPQIGEPIIVTLCDKTIHDQSNRLYDKTKFSRQTSWNRNQPFWNTGPDMFSQAGNLRFLTHDSPMPLIQKWKFIHK